MKKFKSLLLIASVVFGMNAEAGRIFRPAQNAGAQVTVGVTQLSKEIKAHMGKSTNSLKVYFDSRKKDFKAVATGNVALKLYQAIVKTGTQTGNLYIDSRKGLESTALVLAGGAVNWAVETITGLTGDTLGQIPYAGVFVLDLGDNINKFTRIITSNVKAAGLHVLGGTYGVIKDAINTVEDVATFRKDPVTAVGKYLYYLPGKVLDIATLGLRAKK